ncbi:MAG: hypothetical protein U9Q18_01365, partial [Caldisericota bacterium]|nr:hypothetical protein [Caldisericota bacterium]
MRVISERERKQKIGVRSQESGVRIRKKEREDRRQKSGVRSQNKENAGKKKLTAPVGQAILLLN